MYFLFFESISSEHLKLCKNTKQLSLSRAISVMESLKRVHGPISEQIIHEIVKSKVINWRGSSSSNKTSKLR